MFCTCMLQSLVHTETPWHTHKHRRTRRHNHTLISDLIDVWGPLYNMCAIWSYSPKVRWLNHFLSTYWQCCSHCPFRKAIRHQLFTAVMRLGPSADGCDVFLHIWLAFVYIHLSKYLMWPDLFAWAFLFVPKEVLNWKFGVHQQILKPSNIYMRRPQRLVENTILACQ